jgi:ABC-2 type transport system permease protein
MRAALDIALKDLRLRIRDNSALFFAVVAPLGLAFLFSMMIPSSQDTFHATYAVADLDGGPIAAGLVEGLEALADPEVDVADIDPVATEAEARAAVDDGGADAAVVIPAGFSDAVRSGGAATLQVIGGDSALATEVLRSIIGGFASDVTAVQVAVVTVGQVRGEPIDPAEAPALAEAALALPAAIALSEATTADRVASSTTYYGASMAVLFVFFAAQFGVVGLLGERRQGTLARLLASPAAPWAILLGKVLASFVLAVMSMTIVVLATTLLMGARWGDPLAVAGLVLSVSLAATGIACLAVGLAKNEDQAASIVAIVAIVLAVLGGSYFPMSQAPAILATLSLLTPHAWFLRGIDDLAAGTGIAAVLPSIAVLVAIGVVTGGLGLARARRVVAG